MAKVKYKISKIVQTSIYTFYTNVAKKYSNAYSSDLMAKNISNAYTSIYKIENGLMRRKPTIKQWKGYFMANTSKWYFSYKIVEDTIYIEDARHSQNMSEFSSLNMKSNNKQQANLRQKKVQYKQTGENIFGYRVVKLKGYDNYNLIKHDGTLLCTHWFNAIYPLPNLYGKYKIMAYVNVSGLLYALSKDGKVYSLNNLRENVYNQTTKIKLTESELEVLIRECVRGVLKEYVDSRLWGWNYLMKHRYSKVNITNKKLRGLKRSYDKYAQEDWSKGHIPCDIGFDMWCFQKGLEAQKRGIVAFPHTYWLID